MTSKQKFELHGFDRPVDPTILPLVRLGAAHDLSPELTRQSLVAGLRELAAKRPPIPRALFEARLERLFSELELSMSLQDVADRLNIDVDIVGMAFAGGSFQIAGVNTQYLEDDKDP